MPENEFAASDTVEFLFHKQCTTLRTRVSELEENPAIQSKQQQDDEEQV